MAQKPSIPKGTRDFLPEEMVRRNYIFDVIKRTFQRYGYLPIETPAMEKRDTLMGKYGEEGDRLIFQIMPRGRKLEKLVDHPQNLSTAAEEALRYDLTVPFARYVVQHQNELSFPFKRYQIQPVWRADRPQKGRYREFFQCDADVLGSDSLLNELELVQIIDDVFTELGVSVTIKINNRKILSGLAEITGHPDKIIDLTVAIDKLDKIGKEKVIEELKDRGFDQQAIQKVDPIFEIAGSTEERLAALEKLQEGNEKIGAGKEELEYVVNTSMQLLGSTKNQIEVDFTLARGLDYYTGAIFEVKSNEGDLSVSICGGGRYDDLTGVFGLKGMSGVGISFGADRIYDVLTELDQFPESTGAKTQLLMLNFGAQDSIKTLEMVDILRQGSEGINVELYPDKSKLKKQMKYADDNGIPFVAFLGEQELEDGKVKIRNMQSGNEVFFELHEIGHIRTHVIGNQS